MTLSVKEVAELKGWSTRYVQMMATAGKLKCTITTNKNNRKQYAFVPEDVLSGKQLQEYLQHQKVVTPDKPIQPTAMDTYTASERLEIDFWRELIEEWDGYRTADTERNKTDIDREFEVLCRLRYPERNISCKTLYRKRRALKTGDMDSLLDKRGKCSKGKSGIDEQIWQAFLSYYLDEAQHPIKKCYEYTLMWAQTTCPDLVADIPTYTTFYRRVRQDVPEAVEVLGRYGEKAYKDRCAPYIKRIYDDMASNEWWIADNHTFDIISLGDNGQTHRLYLTAFFDARSGIFTGCYVTNAPCSQATLIALRKGILKYGIPDNIYVDNGREFLTFDIGGLGHRKKKTKDGTEPFSPPPVFARLGIKMTNAIVRNAKAKIIERRFRDVKDHLSRLFETYTGGNVVERPEQLKSVLKSGKIPTDAELTAAVEELLDWYFNQQPYGGAVAADRGKTRMQVYNDNLHSVRKATADELTLMLMRSTRPQKVTRRGVHLDISGQRLDYWNHEMLMTLLGKQVYFRYDPDDLSEVRIYDLEDRYIMTVPVDNTAVLKYGASKDEVKAAMQEVRKAERLTKEALRRSGLPAYGRKTALELVMQQARENKESNPKPIKQPKVIRVQRADEQPVYKQVVGGVDLSTMTRNAARKRGGQDNE